VVNSNLQIEATSLRRFRYLILCTSIMTFLLIVMGGIVRVTESGLGCPDWPLCFGRLIPPQKPDAIIEYIHRLVAFLAGLLILISAAVVWWRFRKVRLIFAPWPLRQDCWWLISCWVRSLY
jgi:heme a synthase